MAEIPWDRMFEVAKKAREQAYAPYSNFHVGAAVLAADGSIVPGCNVENSSYGLTVCAERNALARMVVDGQKKVLAVAIVVDTPEPTPPCGMCRQSMAELGDPEIEVRSQNLQGRELKSTVKELLPHAFTKAFFKR